MLAVSLLMPALMIQTPEKPGSCMEHSFSDLFAVPVLQIGLVSLLWLNPAAVIDLMLLFQTNYRKINNFIPMDVSD